MYQFVFGEDESRAMVKTVEEFDLQNNETDSSVERYEGVIAGQTELSLYNLKDMSNEDNE